MKPLMLALSLVGCGFHLLADRVAGEFFDKTGWQSPLTREAEVRVFTASICTLQHAYDRCLALKPGAAWPADVMPAWKEFRGYLKASQTELSELKELAGKQTAGSDPSCMLGELLALQRRLDTVRREVSIRQTAFQTALDRHYAPHNRTADAAAPAQSCTVDQLLTRLQTRFTSDRDAILLQTQQAQEILASRGKLLSEYQIMLAADSAAAASPRSYAETLTALVGVL